MAKMLLAFISAACSKTDIGLYNDDTIGVNPGGSDPQILGRGVTWESWTGRKILLYLIIVQEVCSKVVTFEEK